MFIERGRVKILGLDPSLTSFGVCTLTFQQDKPEEFEYKTEVWKSKLAGTERLEWFRLALRDSIRDVALSMIVLEGYAYGVSRGNSAILMGELGGVLRVEMRAQGWSPVVVPPSKLKKFVTGKGNAGKDVMMLEAYKRFGIEAKTSDEVDATGLALMGATHFGLKLTLPKVNLEALVDVEWFTGTKF